MEGRSRLVLLRHRSDGRFSDGWRPLVRDRRGWNGGAAVSQKTQTTFVGLGRERPLGWRLALLGRAAATSAGLAGPSPENDMRLDLIHSVSSGSDLH